MKRFTRFIRHRRAIVNRIFRVADSPSDLARRLGLLARGQCQLWVADALNGVAWCLTLIIRFLEGKEAA